MLGLTPCAAAVAILPGSRPHEVKQLLGPMLEAYERVRRDRASVDGRVLLAPSLDPKTRAEAIELARAMRVGVLEVDARLGAGVVLQAFDVALCASGTASLEAALARAVPVVAYRVGVVDGARRARPRAHPLRGAPQRPPRPLGVRGATAARGAPEALRRGARACPRSARRDAPGVRRGQGGPRPQARRLRRSGSAAHAVARATALALAPDTSSTHGMTTDPPPRRELLALAALSFLALAARLWAARHVGFGDSEALYASYALHPQPAYLDHPGLVGLFARSLGDGSAPDALTAHTATAIYSTVAPWLVVLAARASGAGFRGALLAGLGVAVVPEIALGLFAMTPDLLLFVAWTTSLACAAHGLRAAPSSRKAAAFLLLAGLLAGIGCAAKVTALTLLVALLVTYLSKSARAHAKTPWPWAGIATGLVVDRPDRAVRGAHPAGRC